MKRIFYLTVILFSAFNINAQMVVSTAERFPELKFSDLTGTIYHKTYNQILGKAFLDDEYKPGRIFLQNGIVIENVKLGFDLFANELIVYQDIKQQLVIVDKDAVKGFEINRATGTEKYLRLVDIKSKSFGKYGSYARILTEGKSSFYKLQYKEQIARQNPSDSYLYEFHDKTEYHLFIDNKDEKIKLRRSVLKRLFPAYKIEIRKFIRQTKIKSRNEDGFARIVEFINTLR